MRVLAVLSILIIAGCAQTSIPETPAGRTLRAWLDAFNSGDRERIQAYQRKFQPNGSIEQAMNFREQSGGFDLLSVDTSERLKIKFHVREKNSPTIAIGKLEVKDGDPAQVASLSLRAIQGEEAPGDSKIDPATRARVIEGATAMLNEFYIFPEIAKKMEEAVKARQTKGEYDAITDGDDFAEKLTHDFQEVSHDKHLHVNFSAGVLPKDQTEGPDAAFFKKEMERSNCGFEKVERMASNIGYLKFNMFGDPEVCGPTAIAAMNFLGNVDAIIFDLRENGGGDPKMVALISSYLFEEPTHLNDLYNRKEDSTTQYWTLPYVPGKKLVGKPVFVLTSHRTFSGAEEFSYNLKNLKRATLVGETTGGGAHPVAGHRIDDHFMIGVPFARAINPISKTNWEGKGVEPDVQAPGAEALDVARKMALKEVKTK